MHRPVPPLLTSGKGLSEAATPGNLMVVTDPHPNWVRKLPNRISLFRMLLVPCLLTLAAFGFPGSFLLCFSLCLVSDFLDGFLARQLDVQSEWGARLDSWADNLSWIAFTCGAAVLWPERFLEMGGWIAAALAAFLIPGLFGLMKYHRIPGFHTWSAKAAMASMGLSVLLLFSGRTQLPFQLSVCLLAYVCIEETLMVHWLPRPRTDLRTAGQAWRIRNESP